MGTDSYPAPGRATVGFGFTLLATVLVITDFAVADAVIPALARDLDLSVGNFGLAFTVYFATAAALMVLFGRVGDALGRRRVLVIALALFAAGSLVSALAWSLASFVAGRILAGLAVAAVLPTGLGILHALYPTSSSRRERAFALWTTTIGISAVLGPLIGGFSASSISWRWAFLGAVPLGVAAAVGARLTLAESPRRPLRGIDLGGALLLAAAAAPLALAVDVGGRRGWGGARDAIFGPRLSPASILLLTGLVAATAFAIVEWRRARQGRPSAAALGLFRVRSFRVATVSSAFMNIGDTGFQLVLPLLVSFVVGADEIGVGVVLACYGAGVAVGGPVAARLARRFDDRRVARVALAALPLLLIALIPTLSRSDAMPAIGALLVAYGVAWGVAYARLVNLSYRDVSEEDSAVAGGVQSALRLLAGALGAAVLTAVFAGVAVNHVSEASGLNKPTREALERDVDPSPRAVNSHQRLDAIPLERPTTNVTRTVTKDAYSSGARAAIAAAAAMTAIALVIAVRLPTTGQAVTGRSRRSRTESRKG